MNTEQKARKWLDRHYKEYKTVGEYGAEELITALLAENKAMQIERDCTRMFVGKLGEQLEEVLTEREALLGALKEVVPYINQGTVSCRGDKCRKRWCDSCFSEEVVEDAIIKMGQSFENVQKAIAMCEESNNVR